MSGQHQNYSFHLSERGPSSRESQSHALRTQFTWPFTITPHPTSKGAVSSKGTWKQRLQCIAPIFLTSALAGHEWSASCPCHLNPGERSPGTHWRGSWVDPRAGLEKVEKILDHTRTRTPTPRLPSLQPVWTMIPQLITELEKKQWFGHWREQTE
jgi:hypothetical protein